VSLRKQPDNYVANKVALLIKQQTMPPEIFTIIYYLVILEEFSYLQTVFYFFF